MVQTSFGFSGRFWPVMRPLFQGVRGREGKGLSVVMVVSDEADPFRLSVGSPSTRPDSLFRKGAGAPKPA
jgi:hypothetical protein